MIENYYSILNQLGGNIQKMEAILDHRAIKLGFKKYLEELLYTCVVVQYTYMSYLIQGAVPTPFADLQMH
jgi:hypothetical protein